jgi:hypothetical protein
MLKYKSTKRIDYLIAAILFGILFFITYYFSILKSESNFDNWLITILLSIPFILCSYLYFSIPTIKLYTNKIVINKNEFYLSDIIGIYLFEKINIPFLWTSYKRDGLLISLKSGKTLEICEENYHYFNILRQNLHLIKLNLEINKNLKESVPKTKVCF